ncbi:MAG: hypothetical protein QXT93_10925 [Thermofilum sp.]
MEESEALRPRLSFSHSRTHRAVSGIEASRSRAFRLSTTQYVDSSIGIGWPKPSPFCCSSIKAATPLV